MIPGTSLVGMTMGARKRAARREWYGGPSHLMRMALRAHPGEPSYMETRALYHIGERLRPCPGCPKCQPGMTIEQIYRQISGRARIPRVRAAYWLRGDADCGNDFCIDCITYLPMLPGLMACLLLHLLGHDMKSPQHGVSGWCIKCNDYCRSMPEQIASRARDARDGGWGIEHDCWRTCDHCGVDLDFCPTDYFVESELDHWEGHDGPPSSGREWWEVLVVLDALPNWWIPDAAQSGGWGRVVALMTKWGCDGSGVLPARRQS